jgi:PAS domain S-box-containing protein
MSPERLDASAEQVYERIILDLDPAGIVRDRVVAAGGRLGDALAVAPNLLDLIHPDDQAFLRANLSWMAEEPGRKGIVAARVARPDGGWFRVTLQLHGQGSAVRAEIALDELAAARRAEAQMRQAIDASLHGIVVRTNEELLYANDGFAHLLGYESRRDVYKLGKAALDLVVHPDDRQTVVENVRARMAGKETVSQFEIRLLRRDAEPLWVAVTACSTIWDGKPASLAWLTNISLRKYAEQELIKSKKAAEQSSRSKTFFLANMSHELRTPLNAVIGFSEMIALETFGPLGSPKYREYIDDIHRSGEHLLDLINDVLDLSKIEAGKLDLHESEVALPDVIGECVSLMKGRANGANLSLRVELPPHLPLLRLDPRATKQVLLNLLSNAMKFTPPGGEVVARASERPGEGVDISVSDTGIGMSPADIEIALTPFGQVHSKQASQHEGTGLGLPLSRALVRLHGGELTVISKPGAGTTVTAHFPDSRVIRAAA